MNLNRKITSLVNKATAFALPAYGKKLPILVVNEYPKCGGTWLAKMLASSIDLPFVDGGFFAPSIPCVLRTHWHPMKSYAPGVCIIRDGRDVAVSLFHHRCKNINNAPSLRRKYQSKFGRPLSTDRIREQLAGFIEIELASSRYGSNLSWATHTRLSRELCTSTPGIALVSYEDLLESPQSALQGIIQECFGTSLGEDRLDAVVALHDIKTSRSSISDQSGTKTTFVRQGGTGGWKDVFGQDSAQVVHQHFGKELIASGFETDDNWWKQF